MKRILSFCFFFAIQITFAQNLQYFLNKGVENSPSLKESQNNIRMNVLQNEIDYAQNSGVQVSFTANYLFAPYFNNDGELITTNPGHNAIGYDIGITNGGLYSALINIEKNIYLGPFNNIYNYKNEIQQKGYNYSYEFEKHSLFREITDQYLTAYNSLLTYRLSLETVQNLNDQLKISEELVQKGYSTVQNYLQLKIEKKNMEISSDENYQKYITDLFQLYTISGLNDTTVIFLDTVKIEMSPPVSSTNFLQKYRLDSLSTVSQQSVYEAKYIPKLNLFFNTGLNAVETNNIQRKFGLSAGVNFNYPLFDGRQKSLTQQQNLISLDIIKNNASFTRDSVEIQRKSSISSLAQYRKNLEEMNSQMLDYQKLLDLTQKQLTDGNISLTDYLILFRNYIDFKKNRIDKEINYLKEINNYNYWNW